ncbi:type IV secretory system conjugative DNA transfer family protein [Salibacterium aidingense]|uniref:type IV secretory system conjugative DNA transfer family protein n=1 Tax=Salibacterium aidingense TaxID=384933 RepID=UPI00040C3CF9|nr:TraM recognition domain-containing protein [Salibacterium aidingense]
MIEQLEDKNNTDLLSWGGSDPFTHTLIVGPTRCGKSAMVIKPIILQILEYRARGIPAGLTCIEPKGDIVRAVKEICDELEVPYHYIDPAYPDESEALNVMKGPKTDIAEATVAVLKSMFGKQEAFFQTIQELSSRKITLLLKTLYGDNMYLIDVLKNLRNEKLLKKNVEKLRQSKLDPDLVDFFDNELLNGKDSEKFRQLVLGLRAQLDNLMSNDYLRPLISRKSDMDLDRHFEEGGVLCINTALGMLGSAGDAFGQFVAMHMQLATFRRKGTEDTRVPHYLIIDEYSRYINPDVERFLSIAAEYRVAGIFACQSLGQLEVESGQTNATAMKKAILTSCRNKIFFGGLAADDAQEVSKEMGADLMEVTEKRYDGHLLKQWQPKMTADREEEKERFTYSMIMDGLPKFHFIYKLLQDGAPQPPGVGVGSFIPRDPQDLRAHFQMIKNYTLEKEEQEIRQQQVPKWNVKARIEQKKRLAILNRKLVEKQKQKQKLDELFESNPFAFQEKDNLDRSKEEAEKGSSSLPISLVNNKDGENEHDTKTSYTPIQYHSRRQREEMQTEAEDQDSGGSIEQTETQVETKVYVQPETNVYSQTYLSHEGNTSVEEQHQKVTPPLDEDASSASDRNHQENESQDSLSPISDEVPTEVEGGKHNQAPPAPWLEKETKDIPLSLSDNEIETEEKTTTTPAASIAKANESVSEQAEKEQKGETSNAIPTRAKQESETQGQADDSPKDQKEPRQQKENIENFF